MGILAENLIWMQDVIQRNRDRIYHTNTRLKMLELGAQYLYVPTAPDGISYPGKYLNPTMDAPVMAKPYFQELGFEHTSIDMNGEGESLRINMSEPASLGKFDVITDFGTSEHVQDLWQCLQNLHEFGDLGTLYFHVNPVVGSWPRHCHWYRKPDFYEKFVQMAGYELLDRRLCPTLGNDKDGWLLWAAMRKNSDLFPSQDTLVGHDADFLKFVAESDLPSW